MSMKCLCLFSFGANSHLTPPTPGRCPPPAPQIALLLWGGEAGVCCWFGFCLLLFSLTICFYFLNIELERCSFSSWIPRPEWWLTTIYNYSLMGSDDFFWCANRCACRQNIHIHKINDFKKNRRDQRCSSGIRVHVHHTQCPPWVQFSMQKQIWKNIQRLRVVKIMFRQPHNARTCFFAFLPKVMYYVFK